MSWVSAIVIGSAIDTGACIGIGIGIVSAIAIVIVIGTAIGIAITIAIGTVIGIVIAIAIVIAIDITISIIIVIAIAALIGVGIGIFCCYWKSADKMRLQCTAHGLRPAPVAPCNRRRFCRRHLRNCTRGRRHGPSGQRCRSLLHRRGLLVGCMNT